MADFETAITVTARLYELRRTARDIRGKRYTEDMVEFKKALRDYATNHKVELLAAAKELGKRAQANDSDVAFMLVMAAYVELSEEA